LFAFALDLLIPALALAVDQREPKASPDGLAAGLLAGALLEEMEDVAVCEKGCEGWFVETEVK
jgi:hypothetical protein